MTYLLSVDYEKCTGCKSCSVACATKRERVCNPLLGRIQVVRYTNEGIHIPIVCQQCEDAPCKRVCPAEAIYRDPVTQVLKIDEERCIGCRFCVLACPFGAMVINIDTRKPVKCDHCDGDPVCVKVCYPEAIKYQPVSRKMYDKRAQGSKKMQELMASLA